jgi:hypothetical protein
MKLLIDTTAEIGHIFYVKETSIKYHMLFNLSYMGKEKVSDGNQ